MKRFFWFFFIYLGVPVCCLAAALSNAHADGILGFLRPGNHKYKKQEPYKPHFGQENTPPSTVVQLANVVDIVEKDLREDGTVVIQQPSVWGQARMTVYRKDFDAEMKTGLDDFKFILSAKIARSDQLSFQSQTALAASLTPAAKGTNIALSSQEILSERNDLAKAAATLLEKSSDPIKMKEAFAMLKDVFDKVGMQEGNLGLEPTIFLDEKKRYLDHLNELRRINMGDDIADSAGYGLYLVRLPVSIEPGHKTQEGHGAVLTVNAEHEFGPLFLQRTFRNLVINDLLDQLTPIVFEILDHEIDIEPVKQLDEYDKLGKEIEDKAREATEQTQGKPSKTWKEGSEQLPAPKPLPIQDNNTKKSITKIQSLFPNIQNLNKIDSKKLKEFETRTEIQEKKLKEQGQKFKEIKIGSIPATIVNGKTYPIAPSDKLRVFAVPQSMECFLRFLKTIRESQHTTRPRATDVRNFIQHELEAAYDIMERGFEGGTIPLSHIQLMEQIAKDFRNRNFEAKNSFGGSSLEMDFGTLMGILQGKIAHHQMGFLSWTIAVDASLLNERLREDIGRINGKKGFNCQHQLPGLFFYLPPAMAATEPNLIASRVFEDYVRVRWPLITFSLDPTVDQQNIADALSIRRDLQLAISYAFASGRISFNQMMKFHRQISMDAETIALNRTVTTFSHGNDTFGWKFSPRYQNPPPQSNSRAMASLLLRTGPHPNYQVNKSQLERGQRELTAVIVMPSFLNSIHLNVRGNWFKLTHPDAITISSGRMLEQGRVVKQLLEVDSATVCDGTQYRPEDIRHLYLKLKQVEKMLPMQDYDVNVPYENTLGGFDLFVPGTTALVPILAGYDGIDTVKSCLPTDANCSQPAFFLYGKHFSILETKVIAGGRHVPDDDVEILSREVIRVKIPKDATQTDIKHGDTSRPFVEIMVATPNGISNRVLIPMPVPPAKADSTPKADATAPLLSLQTTKMVLRTCWKKVAEPCTFQLKQTIADTESLKLKWTRPSFSAPDTIRLRFVFNTEKGPITFTVEKNKFKKEKDVFVLPTKEIAVSLLPKLSEPGFYKPGDTVPVSVKGSISLLYFNDNPVFDASANVADPVVIHIEVNPEMENCKEAPKKEAPK